MRKDKIRLFQGILGLGGLGGGGAKPGIMSIIHINRKVKLILANLEIGL